MNTKQKKKKHNSNQDRTYTTVTILFLMMFLNLRSLRNSRGIFYKRVFYSSYPQYNILKHKAKKLF